MSDVLLLSGRTREGPVLVLDYSADLSDTIVMGADGRQRVVASSEVSLDFHWDPEKGQFKADFEQEEPSGEPG